MLGGLEPGHFVDHLDFPVASMHGSVASVTEQSSISDTGMALLGPWLDVVTLAPRGGRTTPGRRTATVPGDECFTLGNGEEALVGADIQKPSVTAEYGRQDFGVAEHSSEMGGPLRAGISCDGEKVFVAGVANHFRGDPRRCSAGLMK